MRRSWWKSRVTRLQRAAWHRRRTRGDDNRLRRDQQINALQLTASLRSFTAPSRQPAADSSIRQHSSIQVEFPRDASVSLNHEEILSTLPLLRGGASARIAARPALPWGHLRRAVRERPELTSDLVHRLPCSNWNPPAKRTLSRVTVDDRCRFW